MTSHSNECAIPADLVGRVLTSLDALHGELDAAVNPHRLALRALGMTDVFGGAKQPYDTAEAFVIWGDLLQRSPDDWETVHHLAIMRHARAIDLECGADPAKSNSDWEKAGELWHRLWQADAFWEGMASRTAKTIPADTWRALRAQLPALLLAIHYDIAFDSSQAAVHRAKYHMELVRSAPYDDEVKAAVQRDAYTRFISVVPATIWQYQETNPQTIKVGTDRIEEFLAVDPGCVPALEDAVRLQVRLLHAWSTDLGAVGDDKRKRTDLLRMIRASAAHWRPYFDQMAGISTLDEDVRQKVGRWYRLMGDVHCALDVPDKAIGFYEQGIKSTAPDDDEHRHCQHEYVETLAVAARERAGHQEPNARSFCDEVRNRPDLTIKAHFALANAYAILEDFDAAEAVCEHGLLVEPDVSDIDEIEAHAEARHHIEDLRGHIKEARQASEAKKFLDRGVGSVKRERMEEALADFDRAAAIAPHLGMAFFLRAQCHVALGNVQEARDDLAKFRAKIDPSAEARAAADRLEQEIGEMADLFGRFGKEGVKLRREAIAAANAEQFDRAADLLRRAIAFCSPGGKAELERELAAILFGRAVKSVNAAMENQLYDRDAKLKIARESFGYLLEASRLDSTNEQVRKGVKDLMGLIENLEGPADDGMPAEMAQAFDYPGGQELRDKFVQAVMAGRQSEAQQILFRAMAQKARRGR